MALSLCEQDLLSALNQSEENGLWLAQLLLSGTLWLDWRIY